MRILLDANIWVSGLISRSMRHRLDVLIGKADILILGSLELMAEIDAAVARPKFAKYVTTEQTRAYMQIIQNRLDFIVPQSSIQICRDPNDDYLLAICQDGAVDYFITGDKDLIIHDPFGKTRIMTLTDFEQFIENEA
jgi:hypothetical protein